MKYASFRRADGTASFGIVDWDAIVDVGGPTGGSLCAALRAGSLPAASDGDRLPLAEVQLLPVVTDPAKILCVGHNYESHRQETGRAKVDHPSIFTRFADTLVAHATPIVRPRASTDLDYEGELAIVIGKGGRAIAAEDALAHIAGYACFNDASVRDWQWHTSQFTPGKNFPATGGFGPWLVTQDEAGDLSDVHVVTRVNGTVMQDQPIRDMIFSIPAIVAYVSSFTRLEPGDVIATGTPGGVGAKRQPPVWLRPGDIVDIDIGPVGTLSNTIIDEK
ncbi:fumarylacetoacetate hydrolase family protein [Sphingomonas sp. LB3N6]|uniref:fumarylacetoacetate hydrolase family protein n=1 Tax=Sphingomonas fucosidasi TaxID=3096164 RepID=UPI002FC59DB4